MADYWKSNDRKYCDFCKCWISDNKPSISFHENGKRHKLNVAKRITEISRNSAKSELERKKVEADMRKMEEGAMRAYTRDIHVRGDLTTQSIGAVMDANAAAAAAGSSLIGPTNSRSAKQIDPLRLPGNSSDEEDGNESKTSTSLNKNLVNVPDPSLWIEGKSDEGHTYYWNVKTNESIWEAPKEGFMSLKEYERINEIAMQQQQIHTAAEAKAFRENVDEVVAKYNREKLKQYRRPETAEEKRIKIEEMQSYKTEEEAASKEIGSWQTVETKPPVAPIDWQLPEINNYYIPPVVTELPPEPPVKRFKEKTIVSLANDDDDDDGVKKEFGGGTSFKKRKFAAKNNARKRLDDD